MTGRRTSDWLRSLPRSEQDAGDANTSQDRRGQDRRTEDRRAPRRRIDPHFAATLLSQVLPASDTTLAVYPAAKAPRAGIVVNVKA